MPLSLNLFYRGLFRQLEEEGYEVVVVSSPGKDLDEIRSREGVRTVAVPMERSISPAKDLVALWRLVRVIRRERPRMIHSITPKAGLLTMMAGWLCRVPVRLHTFTGLVFPTASGVKRKILKLTDTLTCRFATHVTPEGEGVKRDLIENRITRKPLEVLGYGNIKGVDTSIYDPYLPDVKAKAADLRREGVFTFIFIGRISAEKGIEELLEAFSEVNGRHPDTRLLLVGWNEFDGTPIQPFVEKELSENEAIEYVGFQEDVRPWMAASDALVLPSYREGFPNVVIEGGAMGLPAVVTDINGANEIIEEGKNGLIVPPRDAAALAAAMERMLADGEMRREMAANARPMVKARYEQEFVRQCLRNHYRQLLEENEKRMKP